MKYDPLILSLVALVASEEEGKILETIVSEWMTFQDSVYSFPQLVVSINQTFPFSKIYLKLALQSLHKKKSNAFDAQFIMEI
jgi:hypothetical protein